MFFILMAVFAFCFALGPNLQIWKWSPWSFIADYIPGVRQVRNTFRFAWFVQIALVMLACQTLDWLAMRILPIERQPNRSANNTKPANRLLRCQQTAVLGLALLLATEIWPERTIAHPYPDAAKHQSWTSLVQAECRPNKNVVCLPLPASSKLKQYASESAWMVHGLAHRASLLNGYSGFFPRQYLERLWLYREENLSDPFWLNLIASDTDLSVVKRQSPDGKQLSSLNSKVCEVDLLLADDSGIDVYRLRPTGE